MARYRYSSHIQMNLGFFPAVSPVKDQTTLAYELARHEHYKHLSLCEHGLSSALSSSTAIAQTLLSTTNHSIIKNEQRCKWFFASFFKNGFFRPTFEITGRFYNHAIQYVIRITCYQIRASLDWINVLKYRNSLFLLV